MEPKDFNPQTLSERDFLLLDPLRVEQEGAAPWKTLPLQGLAPPGFEAQAHQLPYLLAWQDLNPEHRLLVRELLLDSDELVSAPMCVGVLQSAASAGDLRRHLRHLLTPHFPGGERGVFRFYDPVVLAHLSWMLADLERSVFFGPVATWSFPLEGNWHISQTPFPGAPHIRFAPGAEVWLRISRIGSLHAVLESEHTWRSQPTRYGPDVEPWLIKADGYGLADREDVVSFARHGLLRHPQFDTHPKVIAVLNECVGHPSRYRRLMSLWSDDDWQNVSRDLDTPANMRRVSITNTTQFTQGAR